MKQAKAIDQKNVMTNVAAVGLILIGYMTSLSYREVLISAGYFALSGALTNWLAIHMLFEKIPYLYGSGVIVTQFESFKKGIKDLVCEQFFHESLIEEFLLQQSFGDDLIDKLRERIDSDRLFAQLVDAIMNSSFSGMLMMVGGAKALQPLKEPVIDKLHGHFVELFQNIDLNSWLLGSNQTIQLRCQLEALIDKRLSELTPQMVKEIMQKMIRQHLGWLVVWGGVFGGLIGVAVSLMPQELYNAI